MLINCVQSICIYQLLSLMSLQNVLYMIFTEYWQSSCGISRKRTELHIGLDGMIFVSLIKAESSLGFKFLLDISKALFAKL